MGDASRVRIDRDGVRTIDAPGSRRLRWIVAAAIGLPIAATVIAVAVIRVAPRGADAKTRALVEAARDPGRSLSAAADAAAARDPQRSAPRALEALAAPDARVPVATPGARVVAHRVATAKRPSDPDAVADDDPGIDARDAIPALIEAGERGGITVFPLPGTKPIKRGVIVPDGFELPEGYVRHYQSTDDGKQLPPILMFHPDYEFVNPRGEPITVPNDRVVPPELAGDLGLTVQMLEVPEKPPSVDAR